MVLDLFGNKTSSGLLVSGRRGSKEITVAVAHCVIQAAPLLLPRPPWRFWAEAPQASAIPPRNPRFPLSLSHRPAHINGGQIQRDRRGGDSVRPSRNANLMEPSI